MESFLIKKSNHFLIRVLEGSYKLSTKGREIGRISQFVALVVEVYDWNLLEYSVKHVYIRTTPLVKTFHNTHHTFYKKYFIIHTIPVGNEKLTLNFTGKIKVKPIDCPLQSSVDHQINCLSSPWLGVDVYMCDWIAKRTNIILVGSNALAIHWSSSVCDNRAVIEIGFSFDFSWLPVF